jgi:hypothetical protein
MSNVGITKPVCEVCEERKRPRNNMCHGYLDHTIGFKLLPLLLESQVEPLSCCTVMGKLHMVNKSWKRAVNNTLDWFDQTAKRPGFTMDILEWDICPPYHDRPPKKRCRLHAVITIDDILNNPQCA